MEVAAGPFEPIISSSRRRGQQDRVMTDESIGVSNIEKGDGFGHTLVHIDHSMESDEVSVCSSITALLFSAQYRVQCIVRSAY